LCGGGGEGESSFCSGRSEDRRTLFGILLVIVGDLPILLGRYHWDSLPIKTFSKKMLGLFRSRFAKALTAVAIALLLFAFVLAIPDSLQTYPNLTDDHIVSLIRKGQTMKEVEAALGTPDSKEERLWYYSNARKSYRTGSTYVPAAISVMFDESGLFESALRGPAP
jgi:outer membrane protein assembly factor BamE (lipoprotein component of BamABCDE complex)